MSLHSVCHAMALGWVWAAALLATAAHAEYKCHAPPSRLDARACEAARQGPAELRHFVQRLRVHESLYFFDYVDEAQAVAWREQEERAALLKIVPIAGAIAAVSKQ
jgi:hypothetical protein